MKSQEKRYRVANFGMVQRHHGVLCVGAFGVALFDGEDVPFLAALHSHRTSAVSTSLLIERYTAADPDKAETRTIVDFIAARDRLTHSGVLVELP